MTSIWAEWRDGAVVVHGVDVEGVDAQDELGIVPVGALNLGLDLVLTAGSWVRSDLVSRFVPRFPPIAASELALVGQSDVGQRWRELARLRIPSAGLTPHTVVDSIDPGSESVPANLLRFSVMFSSTMEEGSAARRILLLDEVGVVMPGTLLEMPPELWDRDRRRLTVLLEPGRIKRGLQPHVHAGAPLREGSAVTIVVESGIRDSTGMALMSEARRTYRVAAPIRARVDPTLWDVRWPQAHPDALVVHFDRPLDRALVRRCLRVLDESGARVPGSASLDPDALEWTFAPATPVGQWALHIDTRLEDLAGNSVKRVFDRDLHRAEDDGIDDEEIVLRPASGTK